ncbi:MAG: hypothetical protein UZ20_WS6002001013 [candidate division WS6 bacterium OLB21]|uniref:Uncharacterized protein n=1 Tax=candidate division WS6 bacterium OLB21 TaxID=1617427 RepID=A0A136KEW8_9BACT|nr:MAG: hypothetical protein UZ20_WS6002001013 [candidate division WS6 bacterium OLB21]
MILKDPLVQKVELLDLFTSEKKRREEELYYLCKATELRKKH